MSDEIVTAPAAEECDSGKRLTPEQWAEIEAHIEYNTMTGNQIREKYGISASAISQHIRRRFERDGYKIIRGSKKREVEEKIAEKVAEKSAEKTAESVASAAVETFEAKRRQRAENFKENAYLATLQMMRLIIKKQRDINDAVEKGHPLPSSRELRQLEQALRSAKESMWEILKIDDDVEEDQLPVLQFQDLTQEEISRLQKVGEEDESVELLPEDLGPDGSGDDDEVVVEGEPAS